jgi:hypothetical protein
VKRFAVAISMGCLLLALVPATTMAVVVPADLDQSNETHGLSIGTTADLAQTFTAGKTGALTDVELYWTGSGTIPVSIYATAAGLPTGAALATTSLTITSVDAWIDFTFGTPANVTSGTMYAIVFNTGETAAAFGSLENYANGQALFNNGAWIPMPDNLTLKDFAFWTYVHVAAPTAAPTAPPTTTASAPAPDSGLPVLLLPVASILFLVGFLVPLIRRQRQNR